MSDTKSVKLHQWISQAVALASLLLAMYFGFQRAEEERQKNMEASMKSHALIQLRISRLETNQRAVMIKLGLDPDGVGQNLSE